MTTDELAGLPVDVREAAVRWDDVAKRFGPESSGSRDWVIIRAELLRLARENAELRSAAGSGELSILKDLAYARETIKRLNRRVQVAEAGVAEKVKESSGRSLGRRLANAAADIFMHERDEALAELAALKREIAETRRIVMSVPPDEKGVVGKVFALLAVGGETK